MTPRGGVVQDGRVRYFAYPEFVLLVATPTAAFKIARITFGRDGSIYVQFPYCIEKQGWIGILPIDPTRQGPTTYALREHGAYVETDVKFAHHTSGEAHFSKTGDETIPSTRRMAWPLTGPLGHLFDLQVMQPDRFTPLTKRDKRVMYLALTVDHIGESVGWHVEWRRKRDIEANTQPPGGVVPPTTRIISRATGQESEVFLLGQPAGYGARDHVLLLTAGQREPTAGMETSGMTFLAGWDTHEVATPRDPPEVRGCLAFIYPVPRRECRPARSIVILLMLHRNLATKQACLYRNI